MPAQQTERAILLLCNDWSNVRDGITSVNRSLALSLARYKGVKVYSTIFKWTSELSPAEIQDAEDHQITLLEPAPGMAMGGGGSMYNKVAEQADTIWGDLATLAPDITHIIAHSPITAAAALRLRETTYPRAHVTLFYHVTPADITWLSEALPYTAPSDTDLVRQAEQADVVYSVTEKLHWYFTARFRNRATQAIDHRLYLPQASVNLFDTKRAPPSTAQPTVVAMAAGEGMDVWLGLDISVCACHKVALAAAGMPGRPAPRMRIGNVARERQVPVQQALGRHAGVCDVTLCAYDSAEDLARDLASCALCIVPARAEPFGHVGLRAMSAGVPTLVSEDSSLAPLIRRLTSEPEYYLVPVTPSEAAVRQDSSLWRDRIVSVLADLGRAQERARQLQMALRRDETCKHTHDDFVALCLGGIRLKVEAVSVSMLRTSDEEKELQFVNSMNTVLLDVLKQAWRLKHHPLTTKSDLFQLIPGVELPVERLITDVIDKIELEDRRIVGVDDETGSFLVYCPTTYSLRDLWSQQDVINSALVRLLLAGDKNPVLEHLSMRSARVRTHISGPEYLAYKQQLVLHSIRQFTS